MSGRKTSCATHSERLSAVAESGRAGSTSGRSTSDRSAGVSLTQQQLAGRRSTNPTRFSGRASCIKKVANVAASVDLMSDTRANRGSIAGRRRASVTQPGIGERRGSMSSIVFAAFAGKGAREKTRRNRPRPIDRINSDLMAAVRNGDTDEVHGCLSTSANETSAEEAKAILVEAARLGYEKVCREILKQLVELHDGPSLLPEDSLNEALLAAVTYDAVSYTHLRAPRD